MALVNGRASVLRMICGALVAYIGLAALAAAAETVYPAAEEPNHKALLDNDKVHVYQVKLKPGEATYFHTHTRDQVGIVMGTAKITNQVMGGPEAVVAVERGSMAYIPYSVLGPSTHRVRASQGDPFWNIGVDFLAPSPDPKAQRLSAKPDQQKLVVPQGTMERVTIEPKGRWTVTGSLLIAMTPGTLGTTSNPKAWTFEEGEIKWIEGATESAYVNASSAPVSLAVLKLNKS